MKQSMTKIGLCLILALCTFAFLAPSAEAGGENVTFKNQSPDTQYVLVVFGGDGKCSEMAEKEQITLAAGESLEVESGDSKVCWCSTTFGKIGDCRDSWNQTKAGKLQRIR